MWLWGVPPHSIQQPSCPWTCSPRHGRHEAEAAEEQKRAEAGNTRGTKKVWRGPKKPWRCLRTLPGTPAPTPVVALCLSGVLASAPVAAPPCWWPPCLDRRSPAGGRVRKAAELGRIPNLSVPLTARLETRTKESMELAHVAWWRRGSLPTRITNRKGAVKATSHSRWWHLHGITGSAVQWTGF